MDPFLSYLTTTQEDEGIDTFKEAMQHRGIDTGGKLMTYVQEMLEKGRAEGLIEKVSSAARWKSWRACCGSGVPRNVIAAAIGLTEAGFRDLKAQLSGYDSQGLWRQASKTAARDGLQDVFSKRTVRRQRGQNRPRWGFPP